MVQSLSPEGRRGLMRLVGPCGLFFGILTLWDVSARTGLYNSVLLPPPGRVVVAWWDLASSGVLVPAMMASIQRVLAGFVLAAVAAGSLAVLMARFELLNCSLRPLIELLRPISPLAWIPLAILWFSGGASVFIVFISSFYPILLNCLFGIQSVSQRHIDVGRAFGAGWWLRLRDIVWPAAKPSIVTGLRLGLGFGWFSLIAAELIAVRTGLGYLIQVNRMSLRMDNVIAVMLTIGLTGMLMNYAILIYAHRTMPWIRDQNRSR
jgi:ABC-type nitrate/sulfonate/bicarbonate transport system permease component